MPTSIAIRRRWLVRSAALFALMWLGPPARSEGPPSVVLIVSDDQRLDTIAALGNSAIETPSLDRLVREGTLFTRATCAYPLYVPSRAELLSGLTSFRNGFAAEGRLRSDALTWPEVMRRAGYRTCYVGKWHTSGRPSERGYEAVDGLFASGPAPNERQLDHAGRPVTGYIGWQFQTDDGLRMPQRGIGLTPDISAVFADAAIGFIRGGAEGPFFLHVNFTAPHDPRLFPSEYENRFSADRVPLPANFLERHPFDHGNLTGRDERLLPSPRMPRDIRQELAAYYAVLCHMDAQIGRILAAIDDTGQAASTIVVFTSDHGLAIGSHGLVGKQNMYEHTVNVPLVMRGPGIAAGATCRAQCYLRDLFPTVCDLAGVPIPPGLDGRSLGPVLGGRADAVHPFVIGYFQNSQRMIRTDRWKLIRYPRAGRDQLFDIQTDPAELSDLSRVPEQQERIAALADELDNWLKVNGDRLGPATH
jgi:arylsulfatase A-like enzyme